MANGFEIFLLELALLVMVSSHPGPLADRNRRAADPGDIPAALTKSPCGDDKTLCETTDLYPAEYIDRILKNSADQFKDLLGVDELSVQVGMRANFGNEFEICRSTERVIFPKSAKNSEDDWRFVINGQHNVQGIRAEICQEDKRSCELSETFPTGFNSSCLQKYIYRKLLILLPNGTLGVDQIKIPSSCSCFVTSPLMKKLIDIAISGKEKSQPTTKKIPTAQETSTGNCEDNKTCESSNQLPSVSQDILEDGTTKIETNEEKTTDGLNRLNENDTTEFELCSSEEMILFPRVAVDKDNEWQNVVGREGVRAEICKKENLPCALSEYYPKGFKSLCKQKYTYRRFLTTSKNGTDSFQSLKVPSTCSCVVTNP